MLKDMPRDTTLLLLIKSQQLSSAGHTLGTFLIWALTFSIQCWDEDFSFPSLLELLALSSGAIESANLKTASLGILLCLFLVLAELCHSLTVGVPKCPPVPSVSTFVQVCESSRVHNY